MIDATTPISSIDPDLWHAIKAEGHRQEHGIERLCCKYF